MKAMTIRNLFLLFTAICLHANAADLYVSNFGGDIQTAVNAATNAGDTVWVEDGTYVLTNQIEVTEAITVRGINGPTAAIIDGDDSTRCFYLKDGGCSIADLTIQNGYSEYDSGGGIYCDYNWIVISNCIIRGNVADVNNYVGGGGLYGGTAIDCLIEYNAASEGGGTIYSSLFNCRVEGNLAVSGGGMAYGSATNCIILNNRGIGNVELEFELAGGGLFWVTAYTCAISGNETPGNGGGAAGGYLYNCTITANKGGTGGGVYEANEIYNCIIWGNIQTGAGEGGGGPEEEAAISMAAAGDDYISGNDLANCWNVYYSCAPELDMWDTGNITNNPVLVSYSHIATNSPCIGAGTTNLTSGGGGGGPAAFVIIDDPEMTATDIDDETWIVPPSMGCDENKGPGTLVGPLDLSIDGPDLIATDYSAEYLFMVDGIPTLVVASLENIGSITNPIGLVEASWSTPGTNDIILTAYNETYPGGLSITQEVVVVDTVATAIHVSESTGDDANDGSSWALAKATIQEGIDEQLIAGGWVLVADGTYTNEMFPIILDRPSVVKGTNAVPAAVIDADESDSCIEISANAVLQGFIVQNGYTWNWDTGAGIHCVVADATVRNCTIRDNYSEETGAGMHGGTAINCSFYNNISESDGSALYMGTAIGCVLANNLSEGSGTAYNSELHNCTVVGNHADHSAGGTYACDLFNTIVWHNTCDSPNEGNDIYWDWDNVWGNVCSPDVEHGVDGSITNDPQLVNSSHLAAGSPCLGAGADALETDIDGEAWLNPPAIGCDEYHSPVTGEINLSIAGLTHCAEGTMAEYSFIAGGPVTQTVADFGDGTAITNPIATQVKTWNTPGVMDIVFTAWNDSYPGGTSVTQQVTVVSLEASTIYVALGGSDTNDGSSWTNAKQTIQAGVDVQTIYGGRVLVSNGTYSVGSPVSIFSPIKLIGHGGRDQTIIDGGGTSQCLNPGANSFVAGFCITNGYGNYGGGLSCNSAAVITNCLITGCESVQYGGGGYSGTYIDCIISGNAGGSGGGLSHAVAVNCLISGNEATRNSNSNGGGANSSTLYQCIVENNRCTYYGGGAVYGESHSCLFVGNHARYGGAVRYGDHYNATMTSNTCTSGSGGAHYAYLFNSIVSGNLRYGSTNDITGNNNYNTCSPNLSPGSNGNISDDPMFVDPASGDYRLSVGSPCFDSGNNANVMVAVDLDGNTRIVGGTVDMGAYELVVTNAVISTSTTALSIRIPVGHNAAETFEVYNLGVGELLYNIMPTNGLVACSPASQTIVAGQTNTVSVQFNTASASTNTYTDMIVLTATGGIGALNSPYSIPVTIEVFEPQLDAFLLSGIPGTVTSGVPFAASFEALDPEGYRVETYGETLALGVYTSAVAAVDAEIGDGTGVWEFPMYTEYEDSRTQVLYLQSEAGAAGTISALSLDVVALPTMELGNWTIRMKHTTATEATDFETNGWTTVYQADTTIGATGWVSFEFAAPFVYNGSDNLLIDFSHNNDDWDEFGECRSTGTTEDRSICHYSDSGDGDPLDWGPDISASDGEYYSTIPNIRLAKGSGAAVAGFSPASVTFVDGIWNGMVTIPSAAAYAWIVLDDGLGHTGQSGLFTVVAPVGPLDSDGDGMSDDDELIAGTDINDPNDFFRIAGISNAVSGTTIDWGWVSNRQYSVYWTDDLVDQPFLLLTNGLNTGSYEDTMHTGDTNAFYLLKVELTP